MGVKSSRASGALGVKFGRASQMMGTKHSPVSLMGLFQAKTEDHTEGIRNEDGVALKQGIEPIKGRSMPIKQFYGLEKKVKAKKYRDEME